MLYQQLDLTLKNNLMQHFCILRMIVYVFVQGVSNWQFPYTD